MQTPTLNPSDARPKFIQIRDVLRDYIAAGHIETGGRFFSERQIASMYRVSANTAAKAVEALQKDGVVDKVVGKGTFIADTRLKGKILLLQSRMSYSLRSAEFGRMISGMIQQALKEAGYLYEQQTIDRNNSLVDNRVFERKLFENEFTGCIVSTDHIDASSIDMLKQARLPLVLSNARLDASSFDGHVRLDTQSFFDQAVATIQKRQPSCVGYLGNQRLWIGRKFVPADEYLKSKLTAAGMRVQQQLFVNHNEDEGTGRLGYRLAHQLCTYALPDLLVVDDDHWAETAQTYLLEHGHRDVHLLVMGNDVILPHLVLPTDFFAASPSLLAQAVVDAIANPSKQPVDTLIGFRPLTLPEM